MGFVVAAAGGGLILVCGRGSGPTGKVLVGPDVYPTDLPRLPPRSQAWLSLPCVVVKACGGRVTVLV